MNIKILTPELVVFEGEVESILLPGELGEFHILNDHAPVVSSLRTGKVKLITSFCPWALFVVVIFLLFKIIRL